MQRLEVSGAVRPIYGSLGVKRLIADTTVGGCIGCIGICQHTLYLNYS